MIRRCLAALMLSASLFPIARAAEEPIPIEQEPQHRLKFESAYVRFFDVELPPGYQTKYHWHHNDGVFVSIVSAPTIAQDWGGNAIQPGESTELYAPCGMLVSVSGGNFSYEGTDASEKIALPPAGFKWRESQPKITLTNVGTSVFHGVDIRIK